MATPAIQHGSTKVAFSATAFRITSVERRLLSEIDDQESLPAAIRCCQAVEGITDWIVLENRYCFSEVTGRWEFIECSTADTTLK